MKQTPGKPKTLATVSLLLRLCTGHYGGKAERLCMKKTANTQKAATDDLYYVSAADVADKLIEHMQRGLDPLLLSGSSLALVSLGPWLKKQGRRRFD
jgi:hypothetical protein